MKNSTLWMAVSGGSAFGAFLIANYTEIFQGASELAAIIQLALNIFVFVVYSRSIDVSRGPKKLIAYIGTAFPIVMASWTIYNVIWPWLSALL